MAASWPQQVQWVAGSGQWQRWGLMKQVFLINNLETILESWFFFGSRRRTSQILLHNWVVHWRQWWLTPTTDHTFERMSYCKWECQRKELSLPGQLQRIEGLCWRHVVTRPGTAVTGPGRPNRNPQNNFVTYWPDIQPVIFSVFPAIISSFSRSTYRVQFPCN